MNPLIMRELVQSAHHRRTYLLRAALPALAAVIIAPQVIEVLRYAGNDWRSMADIARPIFSTTAWMQLIVFSLLALVYGTESLQLEWTRRTMELLCTTPISQRGIVWGKFVSVLIRIFLIGLALLPVMAIWWSMGHIPAGLALGSLAVIAASTVMFAAVAVLLSALHSPGRSALNWRSALIVVLPIAYVAAVIEWKDHPALAAAFPAWAFAYVMSDSAPGRFSGGSSVGITPTWFMLLAVAEPLVIGGLALLAAPPAFGRSFNRFEGGGPAQKGVRGRLSRTLRRLAGKRPALRDDQDPFEWQERGAGTLGLRWAVWLTYAVALLFAFLFKREFGGRDLFTEPSLYLTVAGIAAVVLAFGGALYGAGVFAREKERRTVEALILTGHSAATHYRAKLRAAYRALRWPLASLAVVLALAVLSSTSGDRPWTAVAWIALCCVIGPGVTTVIGLAFGAAARTRGQAVAALVLSLVFFWLIGAVVQFVILFGLMGVMGRYAYGSNIGYFVNSVLAQIAGCTLVILAVRFLTKNWTVWRLSLMLAATLQLAWSVTRAAAMYASFYRSGNIANSALLSLVVVLGIAGVIGFVAYLIARQLTKGNRNARPISLAIAGVFALGFVAAGWVMDFNLLPRDDNGRDEILPLVITTLLMVAIGVFWYRLGVNLFERCMLNLTDRAGGRK